MSYIKERTKERMAKWIVFCWRRFRLKDDEKYYWSYRYEIAKGRGASILAATDFATLEVISKRKMMSVHMSEE